MRINSKWLRLLVFKVYGIRWTAMRTSYFTCMFIRAAIVDRWAGPFHSRVKCKDAIVVFKCHKVKIVCENCSHTRVCSESCMNMQVRRFLSEKCIWSVRRCERVKKTTEWASEWLDDRRQMMMLKPTPPFIYWMRVLHTGRCLCLSFV